MAVYFEIYQGGEKLTLNEFDVICCAEEGVEVKSDKNCGLYQAVTFLAIPAAMKGEGEVNAGNIRTEEWIKSIFEEGWEELAEWFEREGLVLKAY